MIAARTAGINPAARRVGDEPPGLPRRSSFTPAVFGYPGGASDAAELLVEFLSAEQQRGGPAVGAVVAVLGELAEVEQVGDLLGGEAVAGLHRGLARHCGDE